MTDIHNKAEVYYIGKCYHPIRPKAEMLVTLTETIGTLSKDDNDDSENVGKKMNLCSFKLYRVYLNPLNMLNAGDFSWS